MKTLLALLMLSCAKEKSIEKVCECGKVEAGQAYVNGKLEFVFMLPCFNKGEGNWIFYVIDSTIFWNTYRDRVGKWECHP